jgi:hypothetical protein
MISPVDLPLLLFFYPPVVLMQHNIRRLQDLVHALGAQGALHQVADGDGADEGAEAGILSLFLRRALLEDLGGAERRLQCSVVSKLLIKCCKRTYHDVAFVFLNLGICRKGSGSEVR